MTTEPWQEPAVLRWLEWMLDSHRHWTGRELIAPGPLAARAAAAYALPAVLVSHRQSADPCFVYANQTAQALWGYAWHEFIGLPSRLSAPPAERAERALALNKNLTDGCTLLRNLRRVTRDGREFIAAEVLLWTVRDDTGIAVGQAATYERGEFIGN
jgi:PAS domain S-box-containing protein